MRRPELLAITLLSALAACDSPPPRPLPSGLLDTGQPALHAVSDTRLRELMNRMNSLMFERFVAEPDRDRQAQQDTRDIAQAAESLGKSIDGILARLPSLGLSESEQVTFRALADKLRSQAGELRQQAVNHQLEDLSANLAQIHATCTTCHGLFRQLGQKGGRHGS
jgi:hypothetical protein